jgi:hypothetical protein
MAKNKKNKAMKITAEQILKIERSARRQADIELGIGAFKHKAHKMATDYNRQKYKKFSLQD